MDANRHGSRSSAATATTLCLPTPSPGSAPSPALTKHRRSLSRRRAEDSPDLTGALRPQRTSPPGGAIAVSGPPSSPIRSALLSAADTPALFPGVLDIDLEEDGWSWVEAGGGQDKSADWTSEHMLHMLPHVLQPLCQDYQRCFEAIM
jgi:hypothetical protein